MRELRNAVARQLALGELAGLQRSAFAESHGEAEARAEPTAGVDSIERVIALRLPFVKAREKLMQEFERRYVERLLEDHGGDVATAAAAASGIGRRYFQMIRARSVPDRR